MKAFVICLSFASLCCQNIWEDLLSSSGFFRKYGVTWQQLAAVTLDVLILAVVIWIPVCLVAKSGSRTLARILKWCVFAGLMFPLNILRMTNEGSYLSSMPAFQMVPVRILLAVLGVVGGALLLWKWERLSVPISTTIFVILAPLLPLVVASVAWTIYKGPPDGRFPDRPPVSVLPQKAGAPHVLWLLFDEWDESLTYVRRPANLELPELDRFRDGSFHAERAFPPAHRTILSIPSLLAGKTFTAAKPDGDNDLRLMYARNQPPERLTQEPTVFAEAHGAGFNTGIVGFYLPYCRMFDSTFCEWGAAIGVSPREWEYPISLGPFMVLVAKRQASNIPLVRRLGLMRALGIDAGSYANPPLHAVTYRQTHDVALRAIVDPRLNLVFVHWNIPHMPAIYSARKDDFSPGPPSTYVDNLRLVDRTVRDIRLTLEKAGMWDSSTILMTSDHPLRLKKWWNSSLLDPSAGTTQGSEVPFLLKMAGQSQGVAYNAALQTVVTKDLLLAIMKGEISQPEQVAAWLDHNPPHQ